MVLQALLACRPGHVRSNLIRHSQVGVLEALRRPPSSQSPESGTRTWATVFPCIKFLAGDGSIGWIFFFTVGLRATGTRHSRARPPSNSRDVECTAFLPGRNRTLSSFMNVLRTA